MTSSAELSLGNLLRESDVAGALAAYQRAIDSGHPKYAPMAAFGLGTLLQEQGNEQGAQAAYQQAIDLGNPDVTPLAARSLGNLLRESDVAGARAAYQQAIDSGHLDHAATVAVQHHLDELG